MDDIINLEMSGPLAGVLHQQVASSPSDFLALLFGNRSQRETKKASDSQSESFVRTVTLQIEGWVVVDIKEVFDVKTGSFKEAEMNQVQFGRKKEFGDRRKGDWLGMVRIRKGWHWGVQPSYQDQLILEALKPQANRWPKVLHLVFEVVDQGAGPGADLGVPLCRLTSTTFVANRHQTRKIPLKVPNLGGTNKPYKEVGCKGSLMRELEAEAGLQEEKSVLAKMKDKFYDMQTLLEERTKKKAQEVVKLQGQVKVLEDEVEQLERRRELRLEEGADLKRVRALQGPVEVAFQQVIKDLRAGEGIEIVEEVELEEFVTQQQSVETTPEQSADQQHGKPGSAAGSYKEWKEEKRRSAGQSVEDQSKLL